MKNEIKPISPYTLIKSRGYSSLKKFRGDYNKAYKKAGDDMPSSTLSQYEKGLRMSSRRFENFATFLSLTSKEKKGLLFFFEEHKRPLRNAKKYAKKKIATRSKKYQKRKTTYKKSPYFSGATKNPRKKTTGAIPGMNEAGNYLILCKERALRLGKNFNDPAVKIALFAEALGVKTK